MITAKPAPRTGDASLAGLVSYFRQESGEITYLADVPVFVSAEPLDPAYGGRTISLSAAEARQVRASHQARLRAIAGAGRLVTTVMTDRFGRFQLSGLPRGTYYAIVVTQELGRYLVWQRQIELRAGRVERVYMNRNNLSVQGAR
ncbi:MAG: carboxypeptidase-like regulatory domain-containing protein [Candidatus Sericytochromatia bacterium]